MATKIKLDDDMSVNENNDALKAMEEARKQIHKENNIEDESVIETEVKEEAKKPSSPKKKTTTRKKSSLSAKDVMTQKKTVSKTTKTPIISERNEIVNDMKVQINELLPSMNIDLNNIKLSDSLNTMEKHTNIELVFNSKPTFEVVLPQSCYAVFLESLKWSDIDALTNSTMDEYHSTLKLYQIIHNRIQATTVGEINFETFLECTSFFDLDSIFYGLHMQTFPGTTKFDFECVHCHHKFSADIQNDSLIFSKDEKIFERLEEVRMNSDTPDKIMRNSLLASHERICLGQSKTIIDIRIPSLKDQLDMMKTVPADRLEELSDDLATLLFIKHIYLLNVPETLQKKEPVYYEITGNAAMINIFKELSINDSKQLSDAIEKWTNKYKTEYRIPSFQCPSCKKELGNKMTVNMENVLFRAMLNQ